MVVYKSLVLALLLYEDSFSFFDQQVESQILSQRSATARHPLYELDKSQVQDHRLFSSAFSLTHLVFWDLESDLTLDLSY